MSDSDDVDMSDEDNRSRTRSGRSRDISSEEEVGFGGYRGSGGTRGVPRDVKSSSSDDDEDQPFARLAQLMGKPAQKSSGGKGTNTSRGRNDAFERLKSDFGFRENAPKQASPKGKKYPWYSAFLLNTFKMIIPEMELFPKTKHYDLYVWAIFLTFKRPWQKSIKKQ